MADPKFPEARFSGGQVDTRRRGDVGVEFNWTHMIRHDESGGDDMEIGPDVNDGAHDGDC